jgi:hypothetical protein
VQPIQLVQTAITMLSLPIILNAALFVLAWPISRGSSDPTAAGGIMTVSAILTGPLLMLLVPIALLAGAVGIVWAVIAGQFGAVLPWGIAFLALVMAYAAFARWFLK